MPQDKFGDRSPYDYFKGLDIKPNPVKLDIQALLKDVVYKPIRTQHLDASQILAGSFPYEMTDKSPVLKDDPHKKLVFDLPGSPIHTGVQMYSIHTDLSNLNLGKKSPLELGINSDKTGIVIKSGDKSSLVELPEGKPVIVSTIAQDGTLAIAEDGITVENSSYKNSKQPDAKPRDVTNVLVAGLGNEQLVIVKLGKGIVVESLGGYDDLINFLKGYGLTNKNLLTRGGILPKITRKPDLLENTSNDNWRIKYPNRQDSDSRRIRIEKEAPTEKERIIKDLDALLREKHEKHPDDRNRE